MGSRFIGRSGSTHAPEPGKPGEEHYYDIAVRQMRENGAPESVWENTGIWATPWGHGYMGDYHDDSRLVAGLGNPVFEEYRRLLVREHGEKRADEILRVTLWNTILYPNASFMSQFRQLRIIHPLAVDRSVVYTYSFRMKKAPPQMFRDTVAFANVVNGTGSWVLTDDLEVYERIQRGFTSARWTGPSSDAVMAATSRMAVRCAERRGRAKCSCAGSSPAWLRYMTAQ